MQFDTTTLLPDVDDVLRTETYSSDWPSFSGQNQDTFNKIYTGLLYNHGIRLWEDIQKLDTSTLDSLKGDLISKTNRATKSQLASCDLVMDELKAVIQAKDEISAFIGKFNELLTTCFELTVARLSSIRRLCNIGTHDSIKINNQWLMSSLLSSGFSYRQHSEDRTAVILKQFIKIASDKAIHVRPDLAVVEKPIEDIRHDIALFYSQMKTEIFAYHSTALHNYGKLMLLQKLIKEIHWPERISQTCFHDTGIKALDVGLAKSMLHKHWKVYTSSEYSHVPDIVRDEHLNRVNNNCYAASWLYDTGFSSEDDNSGLPNKRYIYSFKWISSNGENIMDEELANELFDRLDIRKSDLLNGKNGWQLEQLKSSAPVEIQKYKQKR